MSTEIKLESCPFCGGSAMLESWDMSPWERMHIYTYTGKWYAVSCTECCASGPDCTTESDAADAWNKRV